MPARRCHPEPHRRALQRRVAQKEDVAPARPGRTRRSRACSSAASGGGRGRLVRRSARGAVRGRSGGKAGSVAAPSRRAGSARSTRRPGSSFRVQCFPARPFALSASGSDRRVAASRRSRARPVSCPARAKTPPQNRPIGNRPGSTRSVRGSRRTIVARGGNVTNVPVPGFRRTSVPWFEDRIAYSGAWPPGRDAVPADREASPDRWASTRPAIAPPITASPIRAASCRRRCRRRASGISGSIRARPCQSVTLMVLL